MIEQLIVLSASMSAGPSSDEVIGTCSSMMSGTKRPAAFRAMALATKKEASRDS